ncbi:MAG TPA: biopolymer transporter ExbD [Verrucomicrobiae bacterium]|nr:biopolymer transporter ExbD [Verrucomicrobiae bacterium]
MRLQRRRHNEDESETGIDLAPMLDFVLNLLIFFIITAVFVREVGITVTRPSNKPQAQEEKKKTKTILIAIRADGEIWIDKRVVDLRAVRANVERYHAEDANSPVVVIADKESPTGILVQVMDQVRQGGVENVSIAATAGGA